MMNEKEAWQLLATAFKAASRDSDGTITAKVNGHDAHGLCMGLQILAMSGLLENETRWSMVDKITELAKKRKICQGDYLWSLTKRGAKARVKFCQNQIQKLSRKKEN